MKQILRFFLNGEEYSFLPSDKISRRPSLLRGAFLMLYEQNLPLTAKFFVHIKIFL
jgi:hypothetical protein